MSISFDKCERALVLCAHTDDEFGCGGTIVRLVDAGVRVHYLALSRCEDSVPEGLPRDILEHESRECAKRLGIRAEDVSVERFKVRHFPAARQEILERFVALRNSLRPDLVLMPSSFDTHQDHRTVYEEGFRAFKQASILGYELPQNLISFSNSAFVVLEEDVLERKIHALQAYASQAFRSYSSPAFMRALAHVRGVQCGDQHAEAFELIRLVAR